MKAEATAENRPAYTPPQTQISAVADAHAKPSTHENQGCIQVPIALVDKVTVILLGFTAEFVVEFGAGAA